MIAREGRSRPAARTGRLLERESELATLETCDRRSRGRARGPHPPRGAGRDRQVPAGGRARGAPRTRECSSLVARRRARAGLPVRHRAPAVRGDPRRRERRARFLSGAASAAAPVFGLTARPAQGDREVTFAVLHGLYWLTVNLSSVRPLVLAVDDLHWCDRASLRFLGYLARRLDECPVLLVASLRPSEPEADGTPAELTSDPARSWSRPGL